MKKLISLMLAMVLMVVLFSGCSNETSDDSKPSEETADSGQEKESGSIDEQLPDNFNPTGFPIVKEKITLTMMGPKAPIHGPWDQLMLFTEMEKLTNIHFEFDTPPLDSFQERKNLAFASGELPDVFFGAGLTVSDEVTYGGQGLLIPLEKLIDQYGPNFKGLMEKDPNISRSITTMDGHIYALPHVNNVPRDLMLKLWINKEWIDKLGLKMPSTVDELYTILKAFKENDPNDNKKPDEIPLSSVKLADIRILMLTAFGFVSNRIDIKDDRVVYVPSENGYKEYLLFMKKLYDENLLDHESFSQTQQQLVAKGNEGKLGMFTSAGPHLVVKPDISAKYPALPPLTSTVNNTRIWPKYPGIGRGTFAITNKNEHPEAAIRWVDYLYSEEGRKLAAMGPENVAWKWVDEGHTKFQRILPEGANPEEFRGGKVTPAAGIAIPTFWDKEFVLKQDNPLATFIDKEVEEKYVPVWKDVYPLVYFTADEQKQLTAIETEISTYVDQMEAKFITGAESLSNWDAYIGNIKKMGQDQLVKIYQDAYNRWKNVK